MIFPKRLRWFFGAFLLVLILLGAGAFWFLPAWIGRQIQTELPFPAHWDPPQREWPLGTRFSNVEIPHPMDPQKPDLLTVRRVILQIPWWGLWVRPLPVSITLEQPHLVLDVPLGDSLLQQADFLPMGETWSQEETLEGGVVQGVGRPLVAPLGLRILEGIVDLWDEEVDPGKPLFSLAHIEVHLGIESPLSGPSIHLSGEGRFVTPEGHPIGFVEARADAGADLSRMKGRLQVWYDRLENFRFIYQDAPEPFTIEGGAGGPVIEWEAQDRAIRVSMRCLAERFRMGGATGGVPWQRLLDLLAGSEGKIDLTVSAEGNMDELHLDIHNRLLSGLDWAIRERAAAAGIHIPGRVFYGLEEG